MASALLGLKASILFKVKTRSLKGKRRENVKFKIPRVQTRPDYSVQAVDLDYRHIRKQLTNKKTNKIENLRTREPEN